VKQGRASRSSQPAAVSAATTARPRGTWLKRMVVLLLSLTAGAGTAEVAVRSLDLFKDERLATRTRDHAASAKADADVRIHPHPFLGYAGNPAFTSGLIDDLALARIFAGAPSEYYLKNSRINKYGFPSEHADYAGDDGGFHVGIFGGSVAEQLATVGGERLIEELERRAPEWHGRVRIFNAAIGGYKQPQQLIALILLTLQGVRFDAIVNVDGFNEVALSSSDAAAPYNPLFPSRLHYLPILELGRGTVSAEAIEWYAQVTSARRRATEWREAVDRGLVSWSELARAVVGRAVLQLEARATRLEHDAQQSATPPLNFDAYDPGCVRDERSGCWDLIADIWEKSSIEMAAIADRMGARYVHVLQPNQYDEGSKPLSAHERLIAYDPDGDWPAGVRRGYPLLRARMHTLLAHGVAVLDLSRLFAKTTDEIYIDTCCHYNLRGTNAVAAAIADRIFEMEAAPPVIGR
jgi:hypothetical protein